MLDRYLNNNELNKKVLKELFDIYLNPSFGTLKQKEIDLFIFSKLIKIGYLKKDVFDIVSKLKITRQKARNLLYEYNLRLSYHLEEEYKEFLKNPILEKDKDVIIFNVENPLLIDFIKSKLKEKRLLSDGSFSPEIIKLKQYAYIELLKDFLELEELNTQLKNNRINNDFESLMKAFLKKVSIKVFNNSNDFIIDEYISPFINNKISKVVEFFKKLKDEN
jgi:translation initiation factor 2 beta subunit (eIF-2beta)/eIF-5